VEFSAIPRIGRVREGKGYYALTVATSYLDWSPTP